MRRRLHPGQQGPSKPGLAFAIKAEVLDPQAEVFTFPAAKTMYSGKDIAEDCTIFIFASETEGGRGLAARGVVISAEPVPKMPGLVRQTPRVSLVVRRTGLATRTLGRAELRSYTDWTDGQPATELNFKLYRQATNKVVGLTEAAAAFLAECFVPARRSSSP